MAKNDTANNAPAPSIENPVITPAEAAAILPLVSDPIADAIEHLSRLLIDAATADDSDNVKAMVSMHETMTANPNAALFAGPIAQLEKDIEAARGATSRLVRDQMFTVYGPRIADVFAYLAPEKVETAKPSGPRKPGRPAGVESAPNRATNAPEVAADGAEYSKRQPSADAIAEAIENCDRPVVSCGTCPVCTDALPTIGQQATANIRQALTRAVKKMVSAQYDASVPCILAFNRAFLDSNPNIISGQLYTRVTNAADATNTTMIA